MSHIWKCKNCNAYGAVSLTDEVKETTENPIIWDKCPTCEINEVKPVIPEMVDFGKRLRQFRIERELNIKECANALNLNVVNYMDIEKGRKSLPIEHQEFFIKSLWNLYFVKCL